MSNPATNSPNGAPTLALRREQAAAALGISVRMVDEMTANGTLPHVRLGKRVILYPVASLEQWLADKAGKGVQP